jgi:hypothetical protein
MGRDRILLCAGLAFGLWPVTMAHRHALSCQHAVLEHVKASGIQARVKRAHDVFGLECDFEAEYFDANSRVSR